MKTIQKSFTSIAAIAALAQLLMIAPAAAEEFFTIKSGELERPTGYREWIYVGTPVTPNDLNDLVIRIMYTS